MDQLVDIVREEIRKYAGDGRALNGRMFITSDEKTCTFAVNAVGTFGERHIANIVVLARVHDQLVIIEADETDKPLIDALEQRGVPREKIVLAYDGEIVPDEETYSLA
jgi:sulfur carrier protein ThiS